MRRKTSILLPAWMSGTTFMQATKTFNRWVSVSALLGLLLIVAGMPASAQTEKVLHSFSSIGALGHNPDSSMVFDAMGNLYGSTGIGGPYDGGSVFELVPAATGGWSLKILHIFGNAGDGGTPYGSLILDAAGNLYGVTAFGGANGAGTVFELSPQTDGSWSETTLYSFGGSATDGVLPTAGVVFGASGNLYGTTNVGGVNNSGTVYELSPLGDGNWMETILHSFGSGTDGVQPYLVTLVLDTSGNIYGTTEYGGNYQEGTVFEVSPTGAGGWTESVLHSFNPNSTEGFSPSSGLIIDAAGNLYGTAPFGGTFGHGTVFELSSVTGGGWALATLHNFNKRGIEGEGPFASLILDSLGNLYGTTGNGGSYGAGTAFVLTYKSGSWTEIHLHSFATNGTDATYPSAPLVLSASGILYGTTNDGGVNNKGALFEIKP